MMAPRIGCVEYGDEVKFIVLWRLGRKTQTTKSPNHQKRAMQISSARIGVPRRSELQKSIVGRETQQKARLYSPSLSAAFLLNDLCTCNCMMTLFVEKEEFWKLIATSKTAKFLL